MSSKEKVQNRVWELVNCDLKGYGDLIDLLMAHMTVKEVEEVIAVLEANQ